MKLKLLVTAALVAGNALTWIALPASADTESYTETFGSISAPLAVGGPDFSALLTLPKFDDSLGILTSIELDLTMTDLLQADVANIGAATAFINAAASGTITVTGADGVQSVVTLATTPFSGSIASGTSASPTYSLGPASSLWGRGVSDVPLSDFGAYEANGSGGSVDFPLNATFDGSVSGNGPSQLSFAGNASVYGSLEIDYTYSMAVPEPGNLLSLSFLCFCGIAGLNRARRFCCSKRSARFFIL